MTTAESAIEGTEEGAHVAPVSSQDDEDKARKLGWVSEAEWKGDKKPERFKTAAEYIADTPHQVLKLLERIEKASEAKIEERVSRIEKVNNATIARLTKLHEQDIAALKAQRREAVKDGNVELVEKFDTAIEKQQKEAPLTDDTKAERDKAEKAFADAHPWYGTNRKMTAFARGLSQDLSATADAAGKSLSFEDNIKAVLIAVNEEFPEYFDKKEPAANGHAAVDGGGEGAAPNGKAGPLFQKLPPEAKAQASKDVKAGVYKNTEEWASAYFS